MLKDDPVDRTGIITPPAAHFDRGFGNSQRIRTAPVAGGVQPETIAAVKIEQIDGPGWGAFRFGIKRDAGPASGVEHEMRGVFLHVVDENAGRVDARIALQHVDDEAGALELVFQMRGVDEDELVEARREFDVFSKTASSFRVFRFRPISPIPRTLGRFVKSGMSARTSPARASDSASFGLRQSREKWGGQT